MVVDVVDCGVGDDDVTRSGAIIIMSALVEPLRNNHKTASCVGSLVIASLARDAQAINTLWHHHVMLGDKEDHLLCAL